MADKRVFANLQEVSVYDSAEFTIGAQTDYNLSLQQANTFSNVSVARMVEIITDATITFKFNSASNHSITLTATQEKYVIDPLLERLLVTNIFITTTGSTNLKIKLFP